MFEKMLDRLSVLNRLDGSAGSSTPAPAQAPKPKTTAAPPGGSTCPETLINKLNERCRVVTSESRGDMSWFWAELQISVNGQWKTAACYQYESGNAMMSSHYANGAVRPLRLNLPCGIVREMATEDFNRNWATYMTEFHRFTH
jgi:hypothetical protein